MAWLRRSFWAFVLAVNAAVVWFALRQVDPRLYAIELTAQEVGRWFTFNYAAVLVLSVWTLVVWRIASHRSEKELRRYVVKNQTELELHEHNRQALEIERQTGRIAELEGIVEAQSVKDRALQTQVAKAMSLAATPALENEVALQTTAARARVVATRASKKAI